jgi:hypothetical protein
VPDETTEHTATSTPFNGAGDDSRHDAIDDSTDDSTDDPIDDPIDGSIDDIEQAMADARHRLAEVPAEVVVTNHVRGLYELAAIHLSAAPPDLTQAALAIDAVACLVEGLDERMGAEAPTMRDALANIRMAFVQIKAQVSESAD